MSNVFCNLHFLLVSLSSCFPASTKTQYDTHIYQDMVLVFLIGYSSGYISSLILIYNGYIFFKGVCFSGHVNRFSRVPTHLTPGNQELTIHMQYIQCWYFNNTKRLQQKIWRLSIISFCIAISNRYVILVKYFALEIQGICPCPPEYVHVFRVVNWNRSNSY